MIMDVHSARHRLCAALVALIGPVEAFRQFRRIRIPRVHAVQRLSMANAKFKHMRDSAQQRELIATGKGSVQGNADWVWAYDPVAEWNKPPVVPGLEVPAS